MDLYKLARNPRLKDVAFSAIILREVQVVRGGQRSAKGSARNPREEQVAAAYLGLVVKHFRDEVADGRLPMPERYGKRRIWEKVVLDRHINETTGNAEDTSDPIMASINAAKPSAVRTKSSELRVRTTCISGDMANVGRCLIILRALNFRRPT
jgi:hypothetical protein